MLLIAIQQSDSVIHIYTYIHTHTHIYIYILFLVFSIMVYTGY